MNIGDKIFLLYTNRKTQETSCDGPATIIDFVCPFNRFRNDEMWDVTIFMDTVSSSPYPDTDKIFEQPEKEPTYRIDSWDDVNKVALEIIEQIQSFEYEEE